MSLEVAIMIAAINGDTLSPQMAISSNYKHWVSVEDLKRCLECSKQTWENLVIAETPYPGSRPHIQIVAVQLN